MDTIIPFALLCFTSFFTLTNPLGTMPVFLTMTKGLDESERQHIIKRATIISFIILYLFYFSVDSFYLNSLEFQLMVFVSQQVSLY